MHSRVPFPLAINGDTLECSRVPGALMNFTVDCQWECTLKCTCPGKFQRGSVRDRFLLIFNRMPKYRVLVHIFYNYLWGRGRWKGIKNDGRKQILSHKVGNIVQIFCGKQACGHFIYLTFVGLGCPAPKSAQRTPINTYLKCLQNFFKILQNTLNF